MCCKTPKRLKVLRHPAFRFPLSTVINIGWTLPALWMNSVGTWRNTWLGKNGEERNESSCWLTLCRTPTTVWCQVPPEWWIPAEEEGNVKNKGSELISVLRGETEHRKFSVKWTEDTCWLFPYTVLVKAERQDLRVSLTVWLNNAERECLHVSECVVTYALVMHGGMHWNGTKVDRKCWEISGRR